MTTVFSTTLIGAEIASNVDAPGNSLGEGFADTASPRWVDLVTGEVQSEPVTGAPPTQDGVDAQRGGVPLYLGHGVQDGCDEGARRFAAWWHPAAVRSKTAQRRHAVVLCGALGREEMSSHASLRALARQLADDGYASLRFDYPGCGDSGGDELDPSAVDAWLESIETAMEALRELSGVERIALLGVRVGALLAARVAQKHPDVAAVACWMPVLSGRTHLRELRLLGGGPVPEADAPDVFEAGGHAMHAQAVQALQGLDARRAPLPMARRWLILERDDLIDPQGLPEWAEQLRRTGALVAHERLPGYAAMMLDPHHCRVPQDWCDATLEWLHALEAPSGEWDAAETVVARLLRSSRAVLEPPVRVHPGRASVLHLAGVREGMVRVPADGVVLNGVVTEPEGMQAASGASGKAVLLVNAGGARRVGPGRLYVNVARTLARAGHVVLRVDLSGIGETDAREGAPLQVAYPRRGAEEVVAAIDFLHARTGRPVDVIGLCAGAYHALHAALRCRAQGVDGLSGVLAINPLTFHDPGPLLPTGGGVSAHKAASEMARYRAGLWSTQRWKRLLSGKVDWRGPARIVGRQLRSKAQALGREASRALGRPRPDDVGAQMAAFLEAGGDLGFLFAEQDPGPALLRNEAGSCVARMQRSGRFAELTVPHADHTFTRWAWRQTAVREILGWVQRAG